MRFRMIQVSWGLAALCACSEAPDVTPVSPLDGGTNVVVHDEAWPLQLAVSPPDDTYQRFGGLVAVEGDDVYVAGAHADELTFRIARFSRVGGVWSQVAEVRGEDLGAADVLPAALVVDDDTVWLGVPERGGAGEVFMFPRDLSAGVVLTTTISEPSFGSSVLATEDWLFVGAPTRNRSAGAVYAFSRSDLSAPPQVLAPPAGTRYARFGHALAQEGLRLFVGAPSERLPSAGTGPGEVHVLELDGGGAWRPLAVWSAPDPDVRELGWSLAVAGGGKVIVGAPSGPETCEGAASCEIVAGEAFVVTGDVSDPDFEPLRPEPAWGTTERFGYSVAAHGETIVIGTPGDSSDSSASVGPPDSPSAGVAYVYSGDRAPRRLRPEPFTEGAQFGWAVAVDGDVVVLGAPFGKAPGVADRRGRVAIFDRHGSPSP